MPITVAMVTVPVWLVVAMACVILAVAVVGLLRFTLGYLELRDQVRWLRDVRDEETQRRLRALEGRDPVRRVA